MFGCGWLGCLPPGSFNSAIRPCTGPWFARPLEALAKEGESRNGARLEPRRLASRELCSGLVRHRVPVLAAAAARLAAVAARLLDLLTGDSTPCGAAMGMIQYYLTTGEVEGTLPWFERANRGTGTAGSHLRPCAADGCLACYGTLERVVERDAAADPR